MTDQEKVKRYDELQTWFKWLEHKMDKVESDNIYIETYLKGTKAIIKPYLVTAQDLEIMKLFRN